MNLVFNQHPEFEGKHAFMSASQWRWMMLPTEALLEKWCGQYKQQIGTVLHGLASDCINARIKLTKHDVHLIDIYMYKNFIPKLAYDPNDLIDNLALFVNESIGHHMSSETVLYYSQYCFGTADAIKYDESTGELLISDYKSGETQAHFEQLMVYAALFYLEYKKKPLKDKTILRIYQYGEVAVYIPGVEEIEKVMELIVEDDKAIKNMRGVPVK